MVYEHYNEKWGGGGGGFGGNGGTYVPISPEEIAEFRKLLERAREYDRKMNQPECELAEKKAALKQIAAALGIDISFVDET